MYDNELMVVIFGDSDPLMIYFFTIANLFLIIYIIYKENYP